MVTKSQREIDAQISKAEDAIESGNVDSMQSFEDGVKAALLWVSGQIDQPPMED